MQLRLTPWLCLTTPCHRGMQTDIYDSMAEGVGNACVAVPFMTDQYQKSENCSLELKFAKQTGV
jgi:hypothetical protein